MTGLRRVMTGCETFSFVKICHRFLRSATQALGEYPNIPIRMGGCDVEYPPPPWTQRVWGLVENFGPKQGMVPYGTSS